MKLGNPGKFKSPIQYHQMEVITDIFWAKGEFESLGEPHLYLNQDGLTILPLNKPQIIPWSFTGLPASTPTQLLVYRDEVQLLRLLQAESNAKYQPPLRTKKLFFYFPLFVVQGQAPMLSEADIKNFLDFWKGTFLPVTDASIHFLTESAVPLPNQAALIYINRQYIQGYFPVEEV
ncbi:MAG TPA: hypothetical protein G4N98_03810 [Thermoflexia bacterium]|nr:hypothetical protein [Thermoflexia bacterium]